MTKRTKTGKKQKADLNDIKKHISEQLNIHDVVCSCYMCGKTIEQPEEQFDMFGEIVCESCWDYNMYQALQDGGGM